MVDLRTASREALLAVIGRQQRELLGLQSTVVWQQAEVTRLTETVAEQRVTIGQLEARLRDLEPGGGTGGRGAMPGHKAEQAAEPEPGHERKRRAGGYGRRRGEPTDVVVHALERCPDCGTDRKSTRLNSSH